MTRAERSGLGLALIGHVALLGLLSLRLVAPERPEAGGGAESMAVELIDAGDAGAVLPDAPDMPAETGIPLPPSQEEMDARHAAAQARAREALQAAAVRRAEQEAERAEKAAEQAAQKSKADAAAKDAARKAEAAAQAARAKAAAAKAEADRKARETAAKAAAARAAAEKAARERAAREAAAKSAQAKSAQAKSAQAKAAAEKAAKDKSAKEKAARDAAARKAAAAKAAAAKAAAGGRKPTGLTEIKLGGDRPPAASPNAGSGGGTGGGMSAAQALQVVDTSLASALIPRFRRCAPTGVDVEQIITRIQIDLNKDGSVANVTVLGQTGLNDSNRPQADLLKSCAIKAVRTAAPFTSLPAQHYNLWKSLTKRLKTK